MWIGIDAGATHTEAVAGTDAVEGRGAGGPANAVRHPPEQLRDSLRTAVEQALKAARRPWDDIRGVCIGMAGVGRPGARQIATAVARDLFGERPTLICPDGRVALAGAFGDGPGIIVQAGTGSVALGSGQRRCGGWGWLVGDEGSATDIGRRALQAALQATDGRRRPTLMGAAIEEHLKIGTLRDAIGLLHATPDPAALLSGLFPLVTRSAETGDAGAIDILEQAGEALAVLATTLHEGAEAVAYGGSVFRYSPPTRERFVQQVLEETAVRAEPALRDAAEGAWWLARVSYSGQASRK